MSTSTLTLEVDSRWFLYRDNDGFYNNIPDRAGFYLLIELNGSTERKFLATAILGQYGSFEFHCLHDGQWINYSENIPENALVEYLPLNFDNFSVVEN